MFYVALINTISDLSSFHFTMRLLAGTFFLCVVVMCIGAPRQKSELRKKRAAASEGVDLGFFETFLSFFVNWKPSRSSSDTEVSSQY